MESKTGVYSLLLPDSLARQLERVAYEKRITKAETIRMIIKKYFDFSECKKHKG